MHPDELAFLRAIQAAPGDDLPRKVYADWLEDTADPPQPERAEFIRVQCDQLHIHGDPDYPHPLDIGPELENKRLMRNRSWELWHEHGRDLLPGGFRGPTAEFLVFPANARATGERPECGAALIERGLVQEVRCRVSQWMTGRCPACQGSTRVTVIPRTPDLATRSCPACYGGGTVGPAVMAVHPVQLVATDRHSTHAGTECGWIDQAVVRHLLDFDPLRPDVLPSEVYALLTAGRVAVDHGSDFEYREYGIPEDADADLSAALIRWAVLKLQPAKEGP